MDHMDLQVWNNQHTTVPAWNLNFIPILTKLPNRRIIFPKWDILSKQQKLVHLHFCSSVGWTKTRPIYTTTTSFPKRRREEMIMFFISWACSVVLVSYSSIALVCIVLHALHFFLHSSTLFFTMQLVSLMGENSTQENSNTITPIPSQAPSPHSLRNTITPIPPQTLSHPFLHKINTIPNLNPQINPNQTLWPKWHGERLYFWHPCMYTYFPVWDVKAFDLYNQCEPWPKSSLQPHWEMSPWGRESGLMDKQKTTLDLVHPPSWTNSFFRKWIKKGIYSF